MPLVDVTFGPRVTPDLLQALRATLPEAVSRAVECPEEPYDGDLRPGDVVLRFQARGEHESPDLDLLVEVRSTWFASRAADRRARCECLRDAVLGVTGPLGVGVYLSLPVAGWAQSG